MITLGTKAVNAPTQQLDTAGLLAVLQDPSTSSIADIAHHFKDIHRLLESLPLTSAEYCFAHNWLTTAQEYWERGETGAACYQVRLVARILALGRQGVLRTRAFRDASQEKVP